MARVLITGGAGFLGSHLATRCITRGDEVHAIVRPQSSLERLQGFKNRLRLHRFSVGDTDRLAECFAEARPQQVFHFANRTRWRDEAGLVDAFGSVQQDLVSLLTLIAVAAAAKPTSQVVVRMGTLAEYGPGPAPFRETQREMPLNAYAAAAVAGTHYIQMLQPRLPFPVITARLALVYGPGQSEDFLVPNLIRRSLAGEPTTLERPNDRRDLIHVDDAVDALLHLANFLLPEGTIVNIATGIAPMMREVADVILRATGADSSLLKHGNAATADGIAHLRGSPDLMHKLTGWQASIPLREGIERTVAWYREQLKAEIAK